LEAVQELVAAGADVCASGHVFTPLQLAARGANEEMVRWLLDNGAALSMSAATADGTTALHLACMRAGTQQIAADILGAGAVPAFPNSSGNTPLHLAAAVGAQDAVSNLLAAGAPACVLNNHRELPLHLALAAGHTAVALQLLTADKGTDRRLLNTVSAAGVAPLHLAAVGPASILKELLRFKGLLLNVVDNAGQTAVHKAAAGGQISNLRLLIQKGASLGVADAAGATPLHLAAGGRFQRCVHFLVSSGADKDALDSGGAAPLHRAGTRARPQLVSLLATPSNINRLVGGTTLLHTAAAGGWSGLVSALLEAGAAPSQQDSQGVSVLVMVARQDSTTMLCLLLRHLLWQHKATASADDALLPPDVLIAMQLSLALDVEGSVWVLRTVLEVLGEGAASALWQQLVEEHRSSLAEADLVQQMQQQDQPRRLGHVAVSTLLLGLSYACDALSEQQQSITLPLEQALQGSSQQPAGAAAVHVPAGGQLAPPPAAPQAGGAAAAVAGAGAAGVAAAGGAPAEPQAPALATISAAARLGQQQEVQGLLQQVPGAAQAAALAEAAKAAGGSDHYQLCVQLVQKLAATDQAKAAQVVQWLVAQSEGRPYTAVEVLGPSSLELCGALLSAWQAMRCQQQREMVVGVFDAVVAWNPQVQAQAREQPHKRRRYRVSWADAPVGLPAAGGVGGGAAAQQQGPMQHPMPAGQQLQPEALEMGPSAVGQNWDRSTPVKGSCMRRV
jgi:ankyrin repeat protein